MTSPTRARRIEEQGRLFWVWLLTLPIILMQAASSAFGAPWPNPLTQRAAMLGLAFPVLFIVGEPLFHEAARALRDRRADAAVVVAALALATYASGALALFFSVPPLAGLSAVVVSTYLTARYAVGRY